MKGRKEREGGEERRKNEERRCIIVQRKNTFHNKFNRAEVQTNLKNNNFKTFLLNILQKDCTLLIWQYNGNRYYIYIYFTDIQILP